MRPAAWWNAQGRYSLKQQVAMMSDPVPQVRWTWDTYLDWEALQPQRYELVDGEVFATGGGSAAHDTIANNLRAELRARLRGTPCRVHGPDLKVHAGTDGRYPDALIDCGPRRQGATYATDPRAVFEVLLKSTAWVDQGLKLRDYDATPSIRSYILISQDEPRAMIYTRDANGRLGIQNAVLLDGMEAAIEIAEFAIPIPFAAIYEGIDFA